MPALPVLDTRHDVLGFIPDIYGGQSQGTCRIMKKADHKQLSCPVSKICRCRRLALGLAQ